MKLIWAFLLSFNLGPYYRYQLHANLPQKMHFHCKEPLPDTMQPKNGLRSEGEVNNLIKKAENFLQYNEIFIKIRYRFYYFNLIIQLTLQTRRLVPVTHLKIASSLGV